MGIVLSHQSTACRSAMFRNEMASFYIEYSLVWKVSHADVWEKDILVKGGINNDFKTLYRSYHGRLLRGYRKKRCTLNGQDFALKTIGDWEATTTFFPLSGQRQYLNT